MRLNITIAVIISLISLAAKADPYLKAGLGLNNRLGITKAFFIGNQSYLGKYFLWQVEGGGFVDINSKSSLGLISASFGVHATGSNFYAKFLIGPALMTGTDDRLSSLFEFNDDLEFGIKGKSGAEVGVNYKHLSNAGLVGPNLGRDFLMLKVQLPF
jgi:hypothetical protein